MTLSKESIRMNQCMFCEIIEKNAYNIFYRDDFHVAIVDMCPKNAGHFLILPVKHDESIFALTDKEFLQFRNVANRILSDQFNKTDFIARYEHYIALAKEWDTKVVKRCRLAIDFLKRTSTILPSGFSFGFNEGSYSGKKHEHVHMHVVPAYENSVNVHGFRSLFFPNESEQLWRRAS
jgi:diadenosine tetraphosphate (Ap4A) HIT family hydrolase